MTSCEDLLSPFYAVLDTDITSDSLNFPTSFDLIKRATRIIDNPLASIRDFALLVQSEPVLTAKVLRMANSLAVNPYGKEIYSAFEAVQRLGSKRTKCLAYLVVMEQVRHDTRSEELKKAADKIWKHSIDVSCLSYMFAKHTGVCNDDEAMLAGIMVDIGQFYLISKLTQFPEIMMRSDCYTPMIIRSHLNVTKQIIDAMKLPSAINDVYNVNFKYHPVWPLTSIEDILMLSSICTDHKNPFLSANDDVKKRSFLEELSFNDANKLETMIDDIRVLKNELFNSLST